MHGSMCRREASRFLTRSTRHTTHPLLTGPCRTSNGSLSIVVTSRFENRAEQVLLLLCLGMARTAASSPLRLALRARKRVFDEHNFHFSCRFHFVFLVMFNMCSAPGVFYLATSHPFDVFTAVDRSEPLQVMQSLLLNWISSHVCSSNGSRVALSAVLFAA